MAPHADKVRSAINASGFNAKRNLREKGVSCELANQLDRSERLKISKILVVIFFRVFIVVLVPLKR